MKELLELSKAERTQYFIEAIARSEKIKNPIVIEKDFWVCWTLDQIFKSESAPYVIFKGGTSLSKCYEMIDRFSEDIDLTLAKEYIGITEDIDPANATGRNQRDKRSAQFNMLYEDKIYNVIHPLLLKGFKQELSDNFNESEWSLAPEKDGRGNLYLKFIYPSALERVTEGYIQSNVKLEFGARGDINPFEEKIITPYVKNILTDVFDSTMATAVNSLIVKRTYWEKATLLHAEHYRDPNKKIKPRLFRHYYDIVMLDQNGLTKDAVEDVGLLADVVKNKSIYFEDKKAKYDEAVIGSLRLSPNEAFIEQLRQDHKDMAVMFFGDAPDFDEIMQKTKAIEGKINNARQS
ncbi:MAG: hypothetical protein A3E85_03030 [Gammaproteobacteria bacterium RIFCSPHIGHO2_12_FULL_45_12]|nr:MAG: hypothetical protein A3E85_03030 [Gammaproteobacteria bacterium RIFCSPHIGHO2_12_FULL_45_12]